MKTSHSRHITLFLALLFLTGWMFPVAALSQAQEDITIIIVRHAEKADDSEDPELSEAGKQRAERLAKMLASTGIDAFYATPFKRTVNTLLPAAEERGATVQNYDPRSPAPFLKELTSQPGKTFLVAGHSNTAPHLVNHLIKEQRFQSLDESIYDHIWFVRIPAEGSPTVMLLHF